MPRVKGVEGGNAVSYEGVTVGLHKYMKMKLSLSILFFLYQ